MFSSDIGRRDVPDMTQVLHVAYERLETEPLDEVEFRELVCVNPARFHTGGNRDFFAGTHCEDAVAAILDEDD